MSHSDVNDDSVVGEIEGTGAIDRTLQADASRVSESERHIEAAAPVLEDGPMSDLKPDDEPPALPAEVFYAWHREGLPLEPSELWLRPTDELLDALRKAIDEGVVPAEIGVDLDSVRARIEQSKLDAVLAAPAPGSTASLGDLLGTMPTPLDLADRRAIAGVAPELHPDDPGLVDRLAAIPGLEDHAAEVARTLRLGVLTAGHLPMVQALQSRLTDDTEGTLRPLATLRPDEWLDLAYTHGTPDGSAITPVAYADALAASVEKQHSPAAVRHRRST